MTKKEITIDIEWLNQLKSEEKVLYLTKKNKIYQAFYCDKCHWLNTDEDKVCFRCGNTLIKSKKKDYNISITLPEPIITDNFDTINFRNKKISSFSEINAYINLEKYNIEAGYDKLISLQKLDILHYEYQINTVLKIMNDFGGRALLADEVGLGKTIEALLFLKEFKERNIIKSALILVPSTILHQWYEEIKYKFKMNFTVGHYTYDTWLQDDFIIASIDTSKKERFSSKLLERNFDLIIVDEAHRLRNSNSIAYKFVRHLKKRFILFLSATPMQNNLTELYNLVTILKPGLLGNSKRVFNKNYIDKTDKRKAINCSILKKKLNEVMIRNRRDNIGISLPKRNTAICYLEMSEKENEFYKKVTEFSRDLYQVLYKKSGNVFPVLMLQRELCSSKEAVMQTLIKLTEKYFFDSEEYSKVFDLSKMAAEIEIEAKTKGLLYIFEKYQLFNKKVIIYTCFYKTLIKLQNIFKNLNCKVEIFHGNMSNIEKKEIIQNFKENGDILISTDTGSEGLNLQFVNNMINYDLPWNPMKIEQRIGRIHRLGQENQVYIWNLTVKSTIEHRIINLLSKKIFLFENVIGNIELILGDKVLDFEKRIYEIVKSNLEGKSIHAEFKKLSDELEILYKNYEKQIKSQQILDNILF